MSHFLTSLNLMTQFILDLLKNPWVILGFFGQFLFFLRFVFQWIASEREKKVVIPTIFWYLSICGAVIIFAYAVYRKDVVFITSTFLSLFIYGRNLMFQQKEKT